MRCLKTIVTLSVLLLVVGLQANAQHYVPLNGVIDTTLVLPKLGGDTAYLVNESLTVVHGGSLQVEAGVVMYFGQSACLRSDGGTLILDGQKAAPIYLRCYEFSHDWAGIQLKNDTLEGMVRLSHVEVMGALSALNAASCAHGVISNCTFNNYYAGKGIELVDCSNFLIDSCLFYQCVSGIELKAQGSDSENNRVSHCVFDQGQINVEVSNVGYGYKCRNNVVSGNCFQGAATAISFESVGGLTDKNAKNFILDNMISSDLPDGSGNYSSFGIKAAMDSLVIRNNVFWSNDEAITMLRVCQLIIENNTFYDNKLAVTNIKEAGSVCCVGNTISEAERRIIDYPSGKSRMNGNNFLHYSKNVALFANVSPEEVDMRGNYWDTQSAEAIDALILDKHDVPALGEIVYEGFLPECDTSAPISPPFAVKQQFVNGSWLVSWAENPESDLDHYVVFYGDFDHYKFSNHIDSVYGNSYLLSSQQSDNVAVMACDRAYDPNVYASVGQSAYAFATYYPYAGEDGELCAPEPGFRVRNAAIPYPSYFVWQTSGTGVFSDSLSLMPTYYPSEADFDLGVVKLTLRAASNGVVKTDEMSLKLFKELKAFAGDDYYGGLNRPLVVEQASADNYDSIRWFSFGDGSFDDATVLHPVYYPGDEDRQRRCVELVLRAWAHCGVAEDTVRYDLYEEFSLEGTIWSDGMQQPNIQVIAAGLNDGNPFFSGFYRTVSDAEGRFKFGSLLPDTYILYAFPDTVEMEMGGAYYLGDYQWNESNMVVVDGDVYDVDIDLPRLQQGFAVGLGRISGVFDYPDIPFKANDFYCEPWLREDGAQVYCDGGLSNVGVLLLNATRDRLLGFALTDTKGGFRFDNLPFGTYHVLSDVPRYGRGVCEQAVLSPEQPVVEGLHLFIDGNGRVASRRQTVGNLPHELRVYPNPADEEIVVCGLESLEDCEFVIVNPIGSLVGSQQSLQADLLGECVLPVHDLPSGMYFIIVSGKVGKGMAKFVKH
ncbi:MAG: right-handed parallel beta-helix repeat-containing protein [Bacteroidales bacterium]|nr:right-handed parallel beta-helix repeat-containing protein [Bacteroidales bacterium]